MFTSFLAWLREAALFLTQYVPETIGHLLLRIHKVNPKATKKIPIVLVHGWCVTNVYHVLLKKKLEKLGYKVYLPDLGWHLKKVEKISKALNDYLKKNKIQRYIYIGVSLGGIIGLHHYKTYKPNIIAMIAMGSPFQGTNRAMLAKWSPAARQIQPKTQWLQALHKKKADMKNVYVIAQQYDEIVPLRFTKLPGATHIIVKEIGHANLVFSKKVFAEVKDILKKY